LVLFLLRQVTHVLTGCESVNQVAAALKNLKTPQPVMDWLLSEDVPIVAFKWLFESVK
jgi:hypothetical protein